MRLLRVGVEFRHHFHAATGNVMGECQIVGTRFELEVRVQVPACRFAIFVRCEDQKIRAGVERPSWQSPFARLIRIVCEIPPEQVHRAASNVLNLDPVFMLAVLVPDRVRIAGEKLGDDDLRPPRRRQKKQKRQEAKSSHRGFLPITANRRRASST